MNLRPSGYEPDELPGCSIPRHEEIQAITDLYIKGQAIAEIYYHSLLFFTQQCILVCYFANKLFILPNMQFIQRFNVAIVLLAGWLVIFPGQAQSEEALLEQKQLQEKLDKEFKTIQKHLKNEDITSLKKQIDALTHDKTIFLFEFTSNVSGVDFPQQRAYFDRTPFIDLLDYTSNLDGKSLKYDYKITKYLPQYGKRHAIIEDESTATGRFSEPFLKKDFDFRVKQNCRNTISANQSTYFQIDSVYCRMHIEYAFKLDKSSS